MAEMGCMVHAYDPTVTLPPNSTHLKFYPMGLGHQDDPENSEMPTLTLQTILEQNGDADKPITYLKLDIEQAEIQVMEQLRSTEIFDKVSPSFSKFRRYEKSILATSRELGEL